MVCLHYRGFVGWLKYSFPFLPKWLKYSLPFTPEKAFSVCIKDSVFIEPTYHTGSLLYVKSVDPADLQVGDPITFMLNEDTVATHRIIEILPDEEDSSVLRFRTQGDANDAPDGTPVHYKNVIGKPVFSVPYLGYFANFVQNPPGLYFAIGFAVVLVLLVFLPDLLDDSDKKGKGKGKGDGAAPTAHD